MYTINPDGKGTVDTYCDMSRDGGGWTLLVTSHTNTWTASDVRKRNHKRPTLNGDFSILYKADDIKDSVNVKGNWFEYRIEANERGKSCNTYIKSTSELGHFWQTVNYTGFSHYILGFLLAWFSSRSCAFQKIEYTWCGVN